MVTLLRIRSKFSFEGQWNLTMGSRERKTMSEMASIL